MLKFDLTGLEEKCEDCVFMAELRHNFRDRFDESYCCIHFPMVHREGYVVEVSLNDRCECFERRLIKGKTD